MVSNSYDSYQIVVACKVKNKKNIQLFELNNGSSRREEDSRRKFTYMDKDIKNIQVKISTDFM